MPDIVERRSAGLSARLADFALTFRLAAASERVRANARCAILDCFGVALLATTQEIGAVLRRFAEAEAAPGPCTLWGMARAAGARDAALVNATLAHGLDFDDRGHSSTYSLAAPLALAEQRDLSGAALLEGFIVAREVRNALDALFASRAEGIGPGARGWHSNGILGPVAAACGAGRLLGLDRDQMLAAIGLATASGGALTRDGGTMAKPWRCGHAASTGIAAAQLAACGASADETPLEGRWGLFEALGPLPESIAATLGADLGRSCHLEQPVRGKIYSSCSASQGALEALLRLRRRAALDPARVRAIECDLNPYPLVRDLPRRGVEGRFSMKFCLAVALLHDRLAPDDFTDAMVADPAIRAIMARVAPAPGSPELVVTLEDGTRLAEPLRRPESIAGWDQFTDKFRRCGAAVLAPAAIDSLIAAVDGLETLASVRTLGALLK